VGTDGIRNSFRVTPSKVNNGANTKKDNLVVNPKNVKL